MTTHCRLRTLTPRRCTLTRSSRGRPSRSAAAGSGRPLESPLGLAWPQSIYSLSHLAVPFRPDDPLFGIEPDRSVDYGARLGLLAPRGERGITSVGADQFMRLNCNPFFAYLEKRVEEWITEPASSKR